MGTFMILWKASVTPKYLTAGTYWYFNRRRDNKTLPTLTLPCCQFSIRQTCSQSSRCPYIKQLIVLIIKVVHFGNCAMKWQMACLVLCVLYVLNSQDICYLVALEVLAGGFCYLKCCSLRWLSLSPKCWTTAIKHSKQQKNTAKQVNVRMCIVLVMLSWLYWRADKIGCHMARCKLGRFPKMSPVTSLVFRGE